MNHRLGRRGFLKTLGAVLAVLGMSKVQVAKAVPREIYTSTLNEEPLYPFGKPWGMRADPWDKFGISAARVRERVRELRAEEATHVNCRCVEVPDNHMHSFGEPSPDTVVGYAMGDGTMLSPGAWEAAVKVAEQTKALFEAIAPHAL